MVIVVEVKHSVTRKVEGIGDQSKQIGRDIVMTVNVKVVATVTRISY